MSILGRRALASASPSKLPNTMGILCGIHALLKNDIRISNPKDEWVFQDMEILKEVSIVQLVKFRCSVEIMGEEFLYSKIL